MAAGVGGLTVTLGGIGTVGFSIVTVISLGILLAIVYKVVLPWMHERREAGDHPADQFADGEPDALTRTSGGRRAHTCTR